MGAVGLILSLAFAAGPAAARNETRPLTLRRAERAIDRAFVAELAGDFAGGRRALSALLHAASRSEEAPGRARLTAWMVSMRARQEAWALSGPSVAGYARAFSTLREFGPERAQLFWDRAVRDLPRVRSVMRIPPAVHVLFERSRGVEPGPALEGIRRRLTGAGFAVADEERRPVHYALRVNVDARQVERRPARVRVTVEGSFLLHRHDGHDGVVASYAHQRSVTRRTEEAARVFAMRRTADDLAWAAIYRLRADLLMSLARRVH